jgi:hypothetical protein
MTFIAGLVYVPLMWIAIPLSIVNTLLHTLEEILYSTGGPFWQYSEKCFGRGLTRTFGPILGEVVGYTLFAGLAALLIFLAVMGYSGTAVSLGFVTLSPEVILGGLIGARVGDALISHMYLSVRFKELDNPGIATSFYYILEALVATMVFTVSPIGITIGFLVFGIFWLVSFKLRRVNDYDCSERNSQIPIVARITY